MSVSVGFIPAGLPSTCESTADSHLGVADLTAAISDANEFLGSQRGSQRRQTSGDAGRHQATKSPASWHFRRRQATFSDGTNSPYKRGVTGSNPVLPTKFSQLDGLFGTLAGDPATTAGNHPVHAPCREACPAAMATSPSTAVSMRDASNRREGSSAVRCATEPKIRDAHGKPITLSNLRL